MNLPKTETTSTGDEKETRSHKCRSIN